MKESVVIKLALPFMTAAHSAARQEAARLQNDLTKLHKYIRLRQFNASQRDALNPWKWPSQSQFEKHFKGKYRLHSQSIQAIIGKFFANIDSTSTKRKNGDRKARFPWRCEKRYVSLPWKGQSAVQITGRWLQLSMGRGNAPLKIKLPSTLPPHDAITQVELGSFELRLTLKRELAKPAKRDKKRAVAVDPGNIHTAVVTDGKDSLGVVGRGLRSINRRYNKKLAHIVRLQSRCDKGSRRWRKLQRSKKLLGVWRERLLREALHKTANAIVDFAVAKAAGTIVFGEITDINRNKRKNKKGSRRMNQENGFNALGLLFKYLGYKAKRHGIAVTPQNEAYTSQTCPSCGHRHKPGGRVYRCRACDFIGIRDEVGAANILNKWENNETIVPGMYVPNGNIKYLRPIKLRCAAPQLIRRSSANDTGYLASRTNLSAVIATPDGAQEVLSTATAA